MKDIQQDVANILGVNVPPTLKPGHVVPRPRLNCEWTIRGVAPVSLSLDLVALADPDEDDEYPEGGFPADLIADMITGMKAEDAVALLLEAVSDNTYNFHAHMDRLINEDEVEAWDQEYEGRYHPVSGAPTCYNCGDEIEGEIHYDEDDDRFCGDCYD